MTIHPPGHGWLGTQRSPALRACFLTCSPERSRKYSEVPRRTEGQAHCGEACAGWGHSHTHSCRFSLSAAHRQHLSPRCLPLPSAAPWAAGARWGQRRGDCLLWGIPSRRPGTCGLPLGQTMDPTVTVTRMSLHIPAVEIVDGSVRTWSDDCRHWFIYFYFLRTQNLEPTKYLHDVTAPEGGLGWAPGMPSFLSLCSSWRSQNS